MKIVHLITRLILGGAQENTLITCKHLADRGHEVALVTGPALGPEGQLFDWTVDQNYRTLVVNSMRREINFRRDLKAYREIKQILTEIQPDIVHTHSAKAGILGRFAADAIRKKSKGKKRPVIVHGIHGLSFHEYQSKRLNKFYIAVEKQATKRTDAFISVADTMTEKALAVGLGKPADYTTAYSAIEEEPYVNPVEVRKLRDFRRKYGISEEAVVLVTVARLAELKGHEYIIESARSLATKYPNCTWLFVGDGDLASEIKHRIRLANLDYRFKFTGMIPTEAVPMAIHASDILVHCSLREGLARVLPQAMLAAKPVISFDIDGAKEVVNKNTGRLIEPQNVTQLTEACAELIENVELRYELGEKGRASVIEKFAPETMVNTIESVYKKLLPDYSV